MATNPVAANLLVTIDEILKRQDATMRFVERITKQLGHLKGVLEASQGPFPGPNMTNLELSTSLEEILKYIEANLLETNDVRELLSGLEETLDGISSQPDKALVKTKLDLGLSDCYLIMEGLLAAKDIGQYILLNTNKDAKQNTPSELNIDDKDENISIQIDILSDSLADEASSLTVGVKPIEPERRVKFDHENGSSLSSLPESTVINSLTSSCLNKPFVSPRNISKTSIQAKLEEFLAVRANTKQKKPENITKLPPTVPQHGKSQHVPSLNLSVTSMDSNTNDSLITEQVPFAASASVLDPTEPQSCRQNVIPIQSLKTLESISEAEQHNIKKYKDNIVTTQQTSINSNRCSKSSAGSSMRAGSTGRTPLKAINTPHQNSQSAQSTTRPNSVKKTKPIVLLDNVSLSMASSPKQVHVKEFISPTTNASPAKITKRTPQSMPATPKKLSSPKQLQPKSHYSTPTTTTPTTTSMKRQSQAQVHESDKCFPTPPKLSPHSPSSNSPLMISPQAKLIIKALEDQTSKQNNVIKSLSAELQSMKLKVKDIQSDYKQQEEEIKQLLLESSKVQNEYESQISDLKEEIAEQKSLVIYWKEKAQQLEQTNQALSHQIAVFKHNRDESIIPMSSRNSDHGSSEGASSNTDTYTHSISTNKASYKTHNAPDYTTLSAEKYRKLEADYLNGLLGNYCDPNKGKLSQSSLSIINLYKILGDYERKINELIHTNTDLEGKLDAYQGLFRAISGSN